MRIAKLSLHDLYQIKKIESKLGMTLIAYDKEEKQLNCIHGHRYCVICKHDTDKSRWID